MGAWCEFVLENMIKILSLKALLSIVTRIPKGKLKGIHFFEEFVYLVFWYCVFHFEVTLQSIQFVEEYQKLNICIYFIVQIKAR